MSTVKDARLWLNIVTICIAVVIVVVLAITKKLNTTTHHPENYIFSLPIASVTIGNQLLNQPEQLYDWQYLSYIDSVQSAAPPNLQTIQLQFEDRTESIFLQTTPVQFWLYRPQQKMAYQIASTPNSQRIFNLIVKN